MPDRARLSDDGWGITQFNDGVAFQVVVELLSGVPVPIQPLVRRNLDEVDENLTVGRELRRKGRGEQVGDLRSGRRARDRYGSSDECASHEYGHTSRNEATLHHKPPFVSHTS
jgi:hypothetical protein